MLHIQVLVRLANHMHVSMPVAQRSSRISIYSWVESYRWFFFEGSGGEGGRGGEEGGEGDGEGSGGGGEG